MSSVSNSTFLHQFPHTLQRKPLQVTLKHQWRNVQDSSFLKDGPINFGNSLKVTCELLHQIQAKPIQEIYETAPVDVETIEVDDTQELVKYIKWLLGSMDDGRISASPYVTAWVALIPDNDGKGGPQFPSCLRWIADNQLADGSWGLDGFFSAYDRLINTLGCVIALKTWNIHTDKAEEGALFVRDNINKLEQENIADHMTIGFEVLFPCLLEMARKLQIELPYDAPAVQDIYAQRDLKLAKIPRQVLHNKHTTLLFSLEGQEGLDWEKILKLQCDDGSLLYSPAATAYAYMHTGDDNSLKYLSAVVQKFNGGVPYIYPVDLFARNWAVDRLQRLGISRYFREEINQCLDYAYRYWTEIGMYSVRNSPFSNIDDTSMAFRHFRMHGYEVSADVFYTFKDGEKFCCFARQSSESTTSMYNAHRASQFSLPGEIVLEEVKEYTYKFLRDRQANNLLSDRWAMHKDFAGEVTYALDVPWYASLPRIETRLYIEQYGGEDDIWIGKSLYKMYEVDNIAYLELAKLDYNKCQELHQKEWMAMKDWYTEHSLAKFGISKRGLLYAYFVAMANIFEPERSTERLAWAKSGILVELIRSCFSKSETSSEQRRGFIEDFKAKSRVPNQAESPQGRDGLVRLLVKTLKKLSTNAYKYHNTDVWLDLCDVWEQWMTSFLEEDYVRESEAELLVRTMNLCGGFIITNKLLYNKELKHLLELCNLVCHQLREFHVTNKEISGNGNENGNGRPIITPEIESNMQKLVQIALNGTKNGVAEAIKGTCLAVAKSFYYTAYFPPTTIDAHISRILFQSVC